MSVKAVTFIDDAPILFVEDNPICCLEVAETLRELGYTVVNAYDAGGAVDALSRGQLLTALVTDIDLGPGVDGFEVARLAREADPALPVVFISGSEAARHDAEGVEGSAFLPKPFSPEALAQALERVIEAPTA